MKKQQNGGAIETYDAAVFLLLIPVERLAVLTGEVKTMAAASVERFCANHPSGISASISCGTRAFPFATSLSDSL
jgi:hypothetical protein